MKKTFAALAAVASIGLTSVASAGTLVINTDTSDPAPKAAFQYVIDKFQAENPDVTVEWNLFDHEGYKQSIRNFLNTNPDLWLLQHQHVFQRISHSLSATSPQHGCGYETVSSQRVHVFA